MSTETEGKAEPDGPAPRVSGKLLLVLLPLFVFAALAGIFLKQLLTGGDVSTVPSALIGQAAPVTKLPPLEGAGVPGLDLEAFKGKVALVNVWASWCGPCREEHPVLLGLSSDDRFAIVGMNYKDKPENARRFLGDLGNPYKAIGVDETGRTAIDWGVYGVPETYVVDRAGTIRYRHVGPLTPESVKSVLLPEIEKALGPDGAG